MSERFLVIGDIHWRGNNPRARTDDFPAALAWKLDEVIMLTQQHHANFVAIAGDLVDSPGMALSTLGDLARKLQRLAECGRTMTDESFELLAVAGNHDMWGGAPDTLRRTPYGLLRRLGLIHSLHENELCLESNMVITGNHYSAETDLSPEAYLVPEEIGMYDGDLNIHIAHGMLLQESPGYDCRHTLIRDVAAHERCPHVLIVGHEHTGFGVIRVPRAAGGELVAINPGALCRLTAHPAEIERQIQVCLLEIEDDGTVTTDLIPITCARPGHEVLSREHLEVQAEREDQMSQFLKLLASEGEAKYLELTAIVADIARRENIPAVVVEDAWRRIGAAREALAGGRGAA